MLTISKVASQAGVNIQTLRYYERKGILPEPARSASGYRQYGSDAVARVLFIKRAQDLGFTLREIAELLDLRVEHASACAEVEDRARRKLALVDGKIRTLKRLERVLKELVDGCQHRRETDDCPILKTLEGEHG